MTTRATIWPARSSSLDEVAMNDRIARQRRIVAEHIRGENEKDWEAVYKTFIQDDRAHYQVVPLGTVFRGIDGARGFYQSIEAAFPDFHIDVRSEYDFHRLHHAGSRHHGHSQGRLRRCQTAGKRCAHRHGGL